jgi:hypothetical protein
MVLSRADALSASSSSLSSSIKKAGLKVGIAARRIKAASAQSRHRTEASNESCHPNLIASDFPKGILALCTLGQPVRSIPQIGEQGDNLLHLIEIGYFNCPLAQVRSSQIELQALAAMMHSCSQRKSPSKYIARRFSSSQMTKTDPELHRFLSQRAFGSLHNLRNLRYWCPSRPPVPVRASGEDQEPAAPTTP